MKKVYFAAMAFAALALTSCGNTETEVETTEGTEVAVVEEVTYNVDTEATTLEWRGSKMKDGVEDHAHLGTVSVSEGMIVKKGEEFVKGQFTVDLTSLEVTDLFVGMDGDADPKQLNDFIGHLSSADFFNFEENKKAEIKVNSMTADNMNVTIMLLGQEKTTDVPVTTSANGDKMMAEGKFTVDMNGILPAVASEGPEYINSQVEFDLNLVMNK